MHRPPANWHGMTPLNACVVGPMPGEWNAPGEWTIVPPLSPSSTGTWPFGSFTIHGTPAAQGWQCPCCRRVHAPHVAECGPCNLLQMLPTHRPDAETCTVRIEWPVVVVTAQEEREPDIEEPLTLQDQAEAQRTWQATIEAQCREMVELE